MKNTRELLGNRREVEVVKTIIDIEKPTSCQDCPFYKEEDLIFDMINPICELKRATKIEDMSIYAQFGTEPTIDDNCPLIKREVIKEFLMVIL